MLYISCNIGTHDLPEMYALGPVALGLWAYISGKSLVPMLQLLHEVWHDCSSYGDNIEHNGFSVEHCSKA